MSNVKRIDEDNILERIFYIRGEKVMLDFDLGMLYGVETRALKQAVRRNKKRFPADFMFELTKTEWVELITNCDNLGQYRFSPSRPFAFTEQGVAMLAGVLKSNKAIEVNISIMRAFVQMRKLLETNKELSKKLLHLEKKYDEKFKIVFDAIKELIHQKSEPRKLIGFKVKK